LFSGHAVTVATKKLKTGISFTSSQRGDSDFLERPNCFAKLYQESRKAPLFSTRTVALR
jgi:hypothetical protein